MNGYIENRIEELKELLAQKVERPLEEIREKIRVAIVPLRICPLGAHIDHQLGNVLGMALDEVILLVFIPSEDNSVSMWSTDFEGEAHFELGTAIPRSEMLWENYARGAAQALCVKHSIQKGFRGIVDGRMPIGGLSSSAAVGIAYLLALEAVNALEIPPVQNIELDRYIENVYFGLKNGILDQSMILMSHDSGTLTYLDCSSVTFEYVAGPASMPEVRVLVAHSGLDKALTKSGAYNNRVAECQEATDLLAEWGNIPNDGSLRLRDIPVEVWRTHGHRLLPIPQRRARHFFTEMERVRQGVKVWRAGDLDKMGDLMNASCMSSIENYESGCPHLITLHEILKGMRGLGVYGSRFSGAGFRGSCIALVAPGDEKAIRAEILEKYEAAHPEMSGLCSVHFCGSGPAARVI